MMMMYCNGNLVEVEDETPIVVDTREVLTEEVEKNLKCPKCNCKQTEEGYDDCLGELKNVRYACCGHGNEGEAYIMFEDGEILRFDSTEEILSYVNTTP